MLLPRGLTIIWGDDKQYWTWPTFEEPDGVVVEMAELLKVCWLEVNGSLDLSLLSPNNIESYTIPEMLAGPLKFN
ncbi:hypothetical protein FRX31_023086 [Thalictrum thalictroides]|uniref:Uncharacterized protein n=1 Tax=Thalictrum thalictroides TaxID=46969 RepID=A0A7J6VSX4_THATH|nr:hypothetical protein FRX31_023086 [Thalictrum thalictroides]